MEDHFGMSVLLDATLGANQAPLKSSPATNPPAALHQCRTCKRSYERADHLSRHLKSHENARPFHCSRCPKRFNRADLLSRHLATHDRHSNGDPHRPLIRRAERAATACVACAASKAKCEDQKPCRRCRTKQIPCETNTSRLAGRARGASLDKSAIVNNGPDDTDSIQDGQTSALHQLNNAQNSSSIALGASSGLCNLGGTSHPISKLNLQPPSTAEEESIHSTTTTSNEMRSTAPYGTIGTDILSFGDVDDMLFLPNVSEFNQDVDFGFWDFDFDGVQLPTANLHTSTLTTQNTTSSNQNTSSKVTRDISRGYAAFKRSPWLWTPAQNDKKFSDSDNLALDEASISSGFTPSATPPSAILLIQSPHLDAGLRDAMFALVLKMTMSKSATSMPSFPPLEILNHSLHAFFVRQSYQIDHWIHLPSFSATKSNPNLIMALISAGSTFVCLTAVWKMGLAFQELARLSIAEMWESNNKSTRDLQALQAFMLCLDVGLWSGFKRKMEIAESLAQPMITMLRRAGVFAAPRDSESLLPELSDSDDRLESKWRKWVERESFKRLSIHLFLHDSRASAVLQKPPLLPFSELNFSLPASRDLWLADTAVKWKEIFLAKYPSSISPMPRMIDVMHDSSLFDVLRDHIDISLCGLALIHGFWGQIWALQEADRFYLGTQAGEASATRRVLLSAQHQELYQDVQNSAIKILNQLKKQSSIVIIVEFFMMTLHISLDELQRFAGKLGEEEASRAATRLQKWIQNAEARKAAWHAGQIFRAARSMPPAELRDFHAITVYFASLTLWTYGLVSSSSGSHGNDGQSLSYRTQEEQADSVYVSLDGPETRETQIFLTLDQGVPGLNYPYVHDETTFESLKNPNMVLKIAREIYRSNFPALEEPLPPLVENLSNLMQDLGGFSGSRHSRSASESSENDMWR